MPETNDMLLGSKSLADAKRLMVLTYDFDGMAYFDGESGRFEIYKKTGERLRIQFEDGELSDFMIRFLALFDETVLGVQERYSFSMIAIALN